jgi:hypothetical protein
VLRKFFGAHSLAVPPVLATLPIAATTITTTTAAVDTTSTSSTSTSGTSSTSSSGGRSGKAPEGARNGYVFGTGEWSASNVSLADAKLSIDNVVAAGEKKKRPHASSSFDFGKVHLEKSTWKRRSNTPPCSFSFMSYVSPACLGNWGFLHGHRVSRRRQRA